MHQEFWAPCIHSDAEKEVVCKWLHEVLDGSTQFTDLEGNDDNLDEDRLFPIIERVLHEIADLPYGLRLAFSTDQWVGVSATGIKDGVEYSTWVEADCFMLALVKTYEVWKNGEAFREEADSSGNPQNGK